MGKLLFSLFLLGLAYAGSYAALVEPSRQTVRICLKENEFSTSPNYRFLSDVPRVKRVASEFYRPLFLLDSRMRPDFWQPMMFGYSKEDARRVDPDLRSNE